MERAQKEALVTTLRKAFSDAGVIVVAHYQGLNVAQMTDLRVKMAGAGAQLKVAKNSLAKLALNGTEAEGIKDLFEGPTAVAYSDDPVAAPKIAVEFAKDNESLVILGGTMGADVLDVEKVNALAALPSLDELRARLVGMISTPATRVARVLSAPASQVAQVLSAYAAKEQDAA